MFDIGFSEFLLLGIIALVFIGPKQLPEVARVIARLLNELRRATGDFHRTLLDTRDNSNVFEETRQAIAKTLADGHKDLQQAFREPVQPAIGEAGPAVSQPPVSHPAEAAGPATATEQAAGPDTSKKTTT